MKESSIRRQTLIFTALLIISLWGCSGGDKKGTGNQIITINSKYYQNPVLGGDYPDPSVLRVEKDFYMTHSSFDYYPGLLIWHSTDLIHWERVCHALNKYVGSVWAPDLVKYKDTFYIYFPAGGTNWVVTASTPSGPWSNPVDLKLNGFIDPGHVVSPDGTRYLYLSEGFIVQLAEDGLSTVGEPVNNYAGWEFPESWSTECFCLESPKSTFKDGYYYLTVAEGGTAGPATSHMVVSARSKSPLGPFENSPYNPVIHTQDRSERWWSQGHGTLVDDVEGNWWIMYHGYEKNFHTLGRQTLMLPLKWTTDNWFVVPSNVTSSGDIIKPEGKISSDGTNLSDDFSGKTPGLQWQFYKRFEPERVEMADGKLILKAQGSSFGDSSPLLVNASDQKYEVQVEFTIDDNVRAGLTMFYDEKANVGIAADTAGFDVFIQDYARIGQKNSVGKHGFLRILNDSNEVSFYISAEGTEWQKLDRSLDAAGYNHNVFGEFLSLRTGIFAFGNGKAIFENFTYRKLE